MRLQAAAPKDFQNSIVNVTALAPPPDPAPVAARASLDRNRAAPSRTLPPGVERRRCSSSNPCCSWPPIAPINTSVVVGLTSAKNDTYSGLAGLSFGFFGFPNSPRAMSRVGLGRPLRLHTASPLTPKIMPKLLKCRCALQQVAWFRRHPLFENGFRH